MFPKRLVSESMAVTVTGIEGKRAGIFYSCLALPGWSYLLFFLSGYLMSGINTDQCADKHDDGAVFMPFHVIHLIHLFPLESDFIKP